VNHHDADAGVPRPLGGLDAPRNIDNEIAFPAARRGPDLIISMPSSKNRSETIGVVIGIVGFLLRDRAVEAEAIAEALAQGLYVVRKHIDRSG